jgi:hypothetical protein
VLCSVLFCSHSSALLCCALFCYAVHLVQNFAILKILLDVIWILQHKRTSNIYATIQHVSDALTSCFRQSISPISDFIWLNIVPNYDIELVAK